MDEQSTSTADKPLGSTIWAGLLGRCPGCHRGRLFAGYLTLGTSCKVCGLDFGFADSGDGPAVFVILVAGFIVTGAALFVEAVYKPPYWVHAVVWGALILVLQLLLLRAFKGLLIALQLRNKAVESKPASGG